MVKKTFRGDEDIIGMGRKLYHSIHDYRQRHMEIPTDPREIHRRADAIRARLKADAVKARADQIERDRLYKDLRLIRFDLQVRRAQPKKEPPIRKGVKILCRTLKSRL